MQATTIRERVRRCIPALGLILCSSVGCALPNGSYQGDPALGNFNRPIAATPPVFTGGDPGMTPGYDSGARLGMPSPDVPQAGAPTGAARASWLVPTYGASTGLLSRLGFGADKPAGVVPTGGGGPRLASLGARLQGVDDRKAVTGAAALTPSTSSASSNTSSSVTFRTPDPNAMMTSGSAIVPPGPAKDRPIVSIYDRSKDPSRITTVEEGQVVLAGYGVKWQRLEQAENGEWLFTCSKGTNPNGTAERRYESRDRDQIAAVRNVVEQVRTDKPANMEK